MYKIISKTALCDAVIKMEIEAPLVARKAEAGQFIILRVNDDGERIPLTIADFDRESGSVTIIFQTVGATTRLLAAKNAGEYISDFVGPLGKATETEGLRKVAVIGGGVGSRSEEQSPCRLQKNCTSPAQRYTVSSASARKAS